ncbi:MAG: CAP64 protein product - [Cyphobasidiales sp. Tagirdzhanova-0007]|nr:MAG: CAP64 protein product - [Cyphobasidiales sp. Tagirdzhanova-0007]
MSRSARRTIALSAPLLVGLYFCVSLLSEPSTRLVSSELIKLRAPWDTTQAPLLVPLKHASAPGFENALPSCRIYDLPDDPLVKEYGQNNIRLSRTYEGSGTRVRRLLQKALRGEAIKVAVVGGSVSTGHGVPSPFNSDFYMHMRIFQWFLDTFPGADHDLNLDSALPASTSWYFSYCVRETLPEDADLVMLELDINHHEPSKESLEATEALYRTILGLPKQPALIYISIFGLIFEDMTHGWRHSALISQWLDVPEINIRNFYLPHLMLHPDHTPVLFRNWADDVDIRHINSIGHKAAADMVIGYLREQLCLVQREGPIDQDPQNPVWPTHEISATMPRLGMLSKWDETSHVPLLHPKCQSVTSTKFPLTPSRNMGWERVDRNDKISYEATIPESEIDFKVTLDQGRLGLYFWMTRDESFGMIVCWVDGDQSPERLRYISGYNPWHPASTFEHTNDMWTDLSSGEHVLTCKIIPGEKGGTIFRISATVSR